MPNYFQLIRKTTGQAAVLQDVDAEMCQHFNVPCDPKLWYLNWYNIIGFPLAMGESFARLAADCGDHQESLAVVEWLDSNFTVESGYRPK